MAWTRVQKNHSYDLDVTTTAKAYADTASVASDNFTQDVSGKGIIVGILKTVAGADVAADLKLQCSHDDTTWITTTTLSTDTNPQTTETLTYVVDLTSISAPFWRLLMNSNSTDLDTTGRVKFIVCGSQNFGAHII